MSGSEIRVLETSMTREEAQVAGARNDLSSARVRLRRAMRQHSDAQWELEDAHREMERAIQRLTDLGKEVS